MPRDVTELVVNDRVRVPLSELDFAYARSSGPGGQNVNKLSTKVQLRWDLGASTSLPPDVALRFRTQNRRRITADGVFLLVSQRFRDQARNRADVLERLRALLVEASRAPKIRRPTRATRGSKLRRLEQKRRRAERKSGRRRPPADE